MAWIYVVGAAAAVALMLLGVIAQIISLMGGRDGFESEGQLFIGGVASTLGLLALVGFIALAAYFDTTLSDGQWVVSLTAGSVAGLFMGVCVAVRDLKERRSR